MQASTSIPRPPRPRRSRVKIPPNLANRERTLSDNTERTSVEQTRTKNPSLPPTSNNLSLNNSQYPDERTMVNLQHALLIEEKLWGLLEKLRHGIAEKSLCEDYWAFSEESPLPILERLFSEERTRKIIRQACIIELSVVCFAGFCFGGDMPPDLIQQFRNLFFYVHQNYLSCMKLMLFRCNEDSLNNTWVQSVNKVIKEKQVEIASKGGQSGFMKQHNSIMCKILEAIGNVVRGPIQSCLFSIMYNLDNITYVRARWLLENAMASMPMIMPIPDLVQPMLPPAPYLPAIQNRSYSLIVDLDETLVHYFEAGSDSKLLVRPGCDTFLNELSKYYEIVIFTAALQDYADWAIDSIDTENAISYRLYRHHTISLGPIFMKDLSRLGRDLSKAIILDNVTDNFRLQPENGLTMKSWFEDVNDTCLLEILPLLKEIVIKEVPDVRIALRNYRDQVLRQIIKGIPNPHLNLITSVKS